MYFFRKLKPPAFNYETIVGLVFAVVFLFLLAFFSIYIAFGFAAMFFIVYAVLFFIIYIRTLNLGYLVLTVTIFLDALFSISVASLGYGGNRELTRVFAFSIIAATIVLVIMIVNRRLKWRSREMLELAAMPVKETSNGFTNRPLPAGKSEYTQMELFAFARFLHSQLIAIPFYEQLGLTFVDFLELFKRGEGSKIINKLNSLRLNPIIE